MKVVATIAEVRAILDEVRRGGGTVGLVPTMGYLHAGHRSLMDRAVAECDATMVTIFVNPLQFAAGEDLDSYPRDIEGDTAVAADAGVSVLFVPSVEEMYPEPMRTVVSVSTVSQGLEGRSRPTHFDGVATVVTKLFAIAGPCRAYFGEKDFQQLAVVRRLASDLSLPVEVIGCPTGRDGDGLALSSRNAYLSPEERAAAPVVHRALQAGAKAIAAGERDADRVRQVMVDLIAAEPLAELDYAEVVDTASLTILDRLDHHDGELRLVAAVRFGRTRLIDNLGATARAVSTEPKEHR